ncbi:hypothetical protein OHF14_06130 [Escherichia coli]|uniref:hypothetical protein n=1 Tax=Escherichia coli TaxID=562 RepID=UPI00198AE11B|nr:hypothetical protein [Escherichia coli]MCV3081160.1 hypothetical protein [Escherichia coli]HAM9712558.1 hypothetical protein [Escherichia coli]
MSPEFLRSNLIMIVYLDGGLSALPFSALNGGACYIPGQLSLTSNSVRACLPSARSALR